MNTLAPDSSHEKRVVSPSSPWVVGGLVAAVTLLGLVLRAASFSDTLYGDELSAYFVVTGHGVGGILDLVQGDQEVTPPLFFLLARAAQLAGGTIDGLRWVPMLSGIACIPLTYLLGVWTLGSRAAVVGAAVMAVSPLLIFYSTEARPYALMMLLCLGSTLALLRAIDANGRAAMCTHYTSAFLLFGQAVWALVAHRGAWRWVVGANVAAAVAWLPLLSIFRADQDSPGSALIGALHPFGWRSSASDVLHWAVGHPISAIAVRDVPGDRALVPIALGLAIGLVAIAVQLADDRPRPRALDTRVWLVVILAVSTPLLAALISLVGESVFLPRNLIASSPGLALLLAAIVTAPRSRAVSLVATALLVGGFAVAGARMLEDGAGRPDYEAVASFITERGGGSVVTVDQPGLSPGPITQLDVALTPDDADPDRPALRLGRPSHATELLADRPDGPGQFALLPRPSPTAIALLALRRSPDGTIFFAHAGDVTFAELRGRPGRTPASHARAAEAAETDAAAFARGLPDDYRAIETRVVPGLFGAGTVSVHQLARGDKRARQ